MPELPEVEVVKRSLKKNILNLIVKKVIINDKKLRYRILEKEFNKIYNKKILSIKRIAKYLLINIENNMTILVHLGMTGKFFIETNKKKQKTSFYYELDYNNKHNHIIFYLSKKIKLIYNDVRKFGFLKVIKSNNIRLNSHLALLGPEPFSKKFNYNYFKRNINKKNKKIKDLLMDQKFVSGLGNIYVNEILHASKINPKRQIYKLQDNEITNIMFFTKKILKKSILDGGSSIKNFNNTEGKAGIFQQKFNVYGKEGEKCKKSSCHSSIVKIVISNRSTFYCKTCQK